jgi:hypothetical protein
MINDHHFNSHHILIISKKNKENDLNEYMFIIFATNNSSIKLCHPE